MTRRHRGAAVIGVVLVALALLPACTDDGDELSVEEFCEQIVVVRTLDDQLGQIETLEIEDTFAELEALTAEAPAEVQPSLEVLTDHTGQVVAAMAAVEPGDTEGASDALTQLLSEEEYAQVEQAGREVEVYTQENCRFDLRSGGTLPPPTTAPPTTAAPETTDTTAAD